MDIDEDALAICKRNIVENELESITELVKLDVTRDIAAVRGAGFDTVVMNPPFGTKNNAGSDIRFVEAGLSLLREGGCLYSLHKSSTRRYVLKSARRWENVEAECVAELRWILPATYKHHKLQSVDIAVDLFRFQK